MDGCGIWREATWRHGKVARLVREGSGGRVAKRSPGEGGTGILITMDFGSGGWTIPTGSGLIMLLSQVGGSLRALRLFWDEPADQGEGDGRGQGYRRARRKVWHGGVVGKGCYGLD